MEEYICKICSQETKHVIMIRYKPILLCNGCCNRIALQHYKFLIEEHRENTNKVE